MNKVFLLLGSNLSDPVTQLARAREMLTESIAPVFKSSSLYITAAWGNTDQPDFINQVIQLKTDLNPDEILQHIFFVENKMGRIRTEKNAPRIIDIDILFYNKRLIQLPDLTIPHPEIQNRRFVLVPLVEIAPNFVHPVLNTTIKELLYNCPDTLEVKRF